MDLKHISVQTLQESGLSVYQALNAAENGKLWLHRDSPERLFVASLEEAKAMREAGQLKYFCMRVQPHEVPVAMAIHRVKCTLQVPSTEDTICQHRGVLISPPAGSLETKEVNAIRFLACAAGLPPVSTAEGLMAWYDIWIKNNAEDRRLTQNGLGFPVEPTWQCHLVFDEAGLTRGDWRPNTSHRRVSVKRQVPSFLQKVRGSVTYLVEWDSGDEEGSEQFGTSLRSAGLAGLDKKELQTLRDEFPPKVFRSLQDLVIR